MCVRIVESSTDGFVDTTMEPVDFITDGFDTSTVPGIDTTGYVIFDIVYKIRRWGGWIVWWMARVYHGGSTIAPRIPFMKVRWSSPS